MRLFTIYLLHLYVVLLIKGSGQFTEAKKINYKIREQESKTEKQLIQANTVLKYTVEKNPLPVTKLLFYPVEKKKSKF